MRGQHSTTATFGVLVAATLYFSLLQSLVTPLMPFLRARFGLGQEAITWLITGYLVVAAVATPLIGQLGDRYGRGVMLRITMIVFTSGSLIAALTDSFPWLVVARMVQGIGGGVFPLAYAIIRDSFPPRRVAGAIGGLSSVMALGSGIGVVMVGPLTAAFGYQSLFWIITGIGVLVCLGVWLFIPLTRGGVKQPTDWLGIVLLSAWVLQLLYASTIGNSIGWLSWQVIGLFAGFALTLGVWVFWESRHRFPLINIRTLGNKTVKIGNLVAFLFGIVMFSSNTFVVAYLQADPGGGFGLGASLTMTGLLLLPQTAIFLIVGISSGGIARRIGSRAAVLLGGGFSAVGYAVLTVWNDTFFSVVLLSCVAGLGISLFFAQITNLILPAIPQAETGAVTGMNNTIRNIGGALGGQVCAAAVGAELVQSGAFLGGYQLVFAFLAIASGLALAACLFVPKMGAPVARV